VRVETSARGFGPIWQAVVSDFHDRHRLGGVRVSINDMGATPAVVSLRLDQAVAEISGAKP
jgi:malonate decarboxylase delta subunit